MVSTGCMFCKVATYREMAKCSARLWLQDPPAPPHEKPQGSPEMSIPDTPRSETVTETRVRSVSRQR